MKQLKPQAFRLILSALVFLSLLNIEALGQTRVTKSAREVVAKSSRPSGESGETKRTRVLALRLRPGQDVRKQLELFVKEKRIQAGFLIAAVGSLSKASIRLADQPAATNFDGKFEIVSLVGTLGQDGVHLHIAISDSTGKTIGGHLVDGCLIYTTAEIVIGDAAGLTFSREKDAETGYPELRIRRNARARKE
jgi:predicted DNA-binding protein with PD1-like motif